MFSLQTAAAVQNQTGSKSRPHANYNPEKNANRATQKMKMQKNANSKSERLKTGTPTSCLDSVSHASNNAIGLTVTKFVCISLHFMATLRANKPVQCPRSQVRLLYDVSVDSSSL